MARNYRRIRPVPDPPLELAPTADYHGYGAAAGGAILGGFLVLLVLLYGVFGAVPKVIRSITDKQTASLTAVIGTVEMHESGGNRWILAGAGQKLQEGDTIRTRENSRALLTLFDQSTATLYPLTELTVRSMRTNHFGKPLGSNPKSSVVLEETTGRALFGVAHLNPVADAVFTVTNGATTADLAEGSYIVKATPNQTYEVVATRGTANVSSSGSQVVIHGGERTQVLAAGKPEAPILAAEDLIQNGTFSQADDSGNPLRWDTLSPQPEAKDVPGKIRLASDDAFSVVRFTRTGSTYHAEQSIKQTINQDVADYSVVRLELRFKVFSHNVSGGGDQGSEYPLMVRVNYLDEAGNPAQFVRGFYTQNDRSLPTTNGQLVQANRWITLAGEQGLPLQRLSPRPQLIQSVEVVASGHDYDSEVQKVSLIIE